MSISAGTRTVALCVALAAALAGCHSTPPTTDSPTPHVTPSPTSTPSVTSTTPSASPTPTEPWAAPADWQPISPESAGVDISTALDVWGAWELPNGALASIVEVPNDAHTTDPNAYFDATFADYAAIEDFTVEHEARNTDSGEPAVVVTVTPSEEVGGDSQQFIVVLRADSAVLATVSAAPDAIATSASMLWAVMRAVPAP